jgi:hypothetical protein
MAKDKVGKKNVNCHKEFKNGSSCAQQRGCCKQFKEHMKNKHSGQPSKLGGPAKAEKSSNCVSLADKCPVHPYGNHRWGDCYQNIVNRDKKFPAKGSKKGKTSMHKANLMDIEPAEKATNRAPSEPVTAIKESKLSGDELSAYMLDSFSKTLGHLSNHLADLKKAKAADNHAGMSFDSIQVLVTLEGSITPHLDEISLSAEQQAVNHKVLNSVFLIVFTHYIDELYSTGDSDGKLAISKHEAQSSRL